MIQTQLLNYILYNKDGSIITENNLNERLFSDYKQEFLFIRKHIESYGVVPDRETFVNRFPNFEIFDVRESKDYLLRTLVEDYNKRQLTKTFMDIREKILSNDTDGAMEIYKKSQDSFTLGQSMRCVDIIRDSTRYDEFVERTQDYNKFYITTGFRELDNIVGGFDREEELATIVARTNKGKSWVLLKCAVGAVLQGLNVGLYSGEMSERKVGYRVDTLIGHMNNGGISHGNISFQNEYKKYIDDLPNRVKGSFKVLTPNMINGPADVGALRSFIEKEKLDMLFVDQLSLLEDMNHAKNPVEKLNNISKDLKNLQVMKHIPIISVCQQNRTSTESGEVDTTQIAGSDRIGQDSTMVVFIERDKEIMKLTLVKSRDSENGAKISYVTDLNLGTFTYIPDEEDGNGGNTDEDYESRYEVQDGGEEPF